MPVDEREDKEVTLPISGKRIVIREGDGFSTRALLKKNKRIFESVYDYIASMCVSIDDKPASKEAILKLLVPDQEYLSIEVYKHCYDEIFDFDFTCPSCEKTNPQKVPLNNLEFKQLVGNFSGPDPVITLKLPRSGKTAVIGMLTSEKELELLQQAATTGPDLNQGDFKALRSLDGKIDFSFEDVIRLKLADHKAIRKARKQLICGYDTNVNIKCPDCEEDFTINILMHPDFLLPGA